MTSPAYAILFKCHYWDGFTQRQLERIKQRSGSGDVFVVIDQTGGGIQPIDHPQERIVMITPAMAEEIGLPHTGAMSVFWYSNDYPLHIFTRRYPGYQYYLMVEYDVALTSNLDALIAILHQMGGDFVGEPIRTPLLRWAWRSSCQGWYEPDQICHMLMCLAVFSNRGAHHLYERRLAAAARWQHGKAAAWPMCEAAVPTELSIAGFKMIPLHRFGSTSQYDTFPFHVETMLDDLQGDAFVHPFLDMQHLVWKIAAMDPDMLLDETHPLHQSLDAEAFARALPQLHHRLWCEPDEHRRRRVIQRLRNSNDFTYLRLHGLDGSNLALGKPATQSSLGHPVLPRPVVDPVR